jgi:O-antigen/teichoic acid export membrane protein
MVTKRTDDLSEIRTVGMADRSSPSGRSLARNAALTFGSKVIPLAVAFWVIPPLVRGLGTDRFGVLTFVWLVIGYFSLFDLGLGRATTKFVAEALGKGENESLKSLVWTSFIFHLAFGILAAFALVASTPLLSGHLLKIPAGLSEEARQTFFLISLSIPLLLVSSVMRGVLEAGQRFDLITWVQVPAGSLVVILPYAGVLLGLRLPGIALLLIAARLAVAITYFFLCRRVFPVLGEGLFFERSYIRPLFSFGGWLTVSNIVGPVLTYLDRFMIGSLISMTAVTYYTAPYEVLIRLVVFPTSLAAVLFPAFSSIGASSKELISRLYSRSIKYLVLLMGPIVLIMILFAGQVLSLWLGPDFAEKSTFVFQILALGILLTPVQVSVSLIHGLGRPDITAKFYIAELLFYVPLVWLLIRNAGISGAALAWVIRVVVDTLLLLIASGRLFHIGTRSLREHGLFRGLFTLAGLGGVFYLMSVSGMPVFARAIAACSSVAAFALVSWRYVLDAKDKALLGFGGPGPS